jgi:hypothetical protein
MSKQATSWSFSKLGDFEQCKLKFKIKHLDRVPEPDRPLPAGKLEHANDRGTRLHQECEDYVSGVSKDLSSELHHFYDRLALLRALYKDKLVSLEGEWGVDKDWAIADWKTAWQRAKLDAMVHHSKTEATVIDYKSGRKFGNEIKHGEQLMLYQLLAFSRFPHLEVVHAELWYLDHGIVTSKTYTRMQGIRFRDNFNRRGLAITDCTDFPANPNVHSCKWCPYGPKGTGHCQVGV